MRTGAGICGEGNGDTRPHAAALTEWKSRRQRGRLIGRRSERPVNNESPGELAGEGSGKEGGEEGSQKCVCVCVCEPRANTHTRKHLKQQKLGNANMTVLSPAQTPLNSRLLL